MRLKKYMVFIIFILGFCAIFKDVTQELSKNSDAVNFRPPSIITQLSYYIFSTLLSVTCLVVFSILLIFLFNFFSSYFDKGHKEYSFENDKGLSLGLMCLLTFISWKFGFFLFWFF